MKKFILFVIVAILSLNIKAQIPNPGFETWNTTSFEMLNNWFVTGAVTKATPGQAGSFAVKLTSGSSVDVADVSTFNMGGTPCAQRPDSLIAYFKCNLQNNDSAQILLFFSKAGNAISINFYNIGGINTSTYKRMAFYIDYLFPVAIPDTVLIDISSTNTQNTTAGNYIIVDNIQLTKNGIPITDQIPNSSFENWTPKSFKEPGGWVTSNQVLELFGGGPTYPVTQSATAHSGTSAIRLENVAGGMFGIIPGIAITGTDIFSVGLDVPSFPINTRYSKLNGYCKFTSVGGDTANIEVSLFKNGSMVGSGSFKSSASITTYTPFTCFITYNGSFSGTPDSATIQVSAYNYEPAGVGSVLYVDDLAFATGGAGINDNVNNTHVSAMPNPFNENFVLQYEVKNEESVYVNIFDINGKIVKEIKEERLKRGIYQNEIDLSNQPSGIYFYQCTINNKPITGRIIKQ